VWDINGMKILLLLGERTYCFKPVETLTPPPHKSGQGNKSVCCFFTMVANTISAALNPISSLALMWYGVSSFTWAWTLRRPRSREFYRLSLVLPASQ
jgi:hypothetical protein